MPLEEDAYLTNQDKTERLYESGFSSFRTDCDGSWESRRQTGCMTANVPSDSQKFQWNRQRTWDIDKCLIPVLDSLNKAGSKYGTISCCCGHGVEEFYIGIQLEPTNFNIDEVESTIRQFHPQLDGCKLHLGTGESHFRHYDDKKIWSILFTFSEESTPHSFFNLITGTKSYIDTKSTMSFRNMFDFLDHLNCYKPRSLEDLGHHIKLSELIECMTSHYRSFDHYLPEKIWSFENDELRRYEIRLNSDEVSFWDSAGVRMTWSNWEEFLKACPKLYLSPDSFMLARPLLVAIE